MNGFAIMNELLVPGIGLCILIPLMISIAVMQGNEYSRKIYMAMLITCMGILLAESFQFFLEGQAGDVSTGTYRFVYFIFYLLIVILCFLWTVYAYYWFNGHAPPAAGGLFRVRPGLHMISGSSSVQDEIYFIDKAGSMREDAICLFSVQLSLHAGRDYGDGGRFH